MLVTIPNVSSAASTTGTADALITGRGCLTMTFTPVTNSDISSTSNTFQLTINFIDAVSVIRRASFGGVGSLITEVHPLRDYGSSPTTTGSVRTPAQLLIDLNSVSDNDPNTPGAIFLKDSASKIYLPTSAAVIVPSQASPHAPTTVLTVTFSSLPNGLIFNASIGGLRFVNPTWEALSAYSFAMYFTGVGAPISHSGSTFRTPDLASPIFNQYCPKMKSRNDWIASNIQFTSPTIAVLPTPTAVILPTSKSLSIMGKFDPSRRSTTVVINTATFSNNIYYLRSAVTLQIQKPQTATVSIPATQSTKIYTPVHEAVYGDVAITNSYDLFFPIRRTYELVSSDWVQNNVFNQIGTPSTTFQVWQSSTYVSLLNDLSIYSKTKVTDIEALITDTSSPNYYEAYLKQADGTYLWVGYKLQWMDPSWTGPVKAWYRTSASSVDALDKRPSYVCSAGSERALTSTTCPKCSLVRFIWGTDLQMPYRLYSLSKPLKNPPDSSSVTIKVSGISNNPTTLSTSSATSSNLGILLSSDTADATGILTNLPDYSLNAIDGVRDISDWSVLVPINRQTGADDWSVMEKWLLLPNSMFGTQCGKIGVTMEMFALDTDPCAKHVGSCLGPNQLAYYINNPLQGSMQLLPVYNTYLQGNRISWNAATSSIDLLFMDQAHLFNYNVEIPQRLLVFKQPSLSPLVVVGANAWQVNAGSSTSSTVSGAVQNNGDLSSDVTVTVACTNAIVSGNGLAMQTIVAGTTVFYNFDLTTPPSSVTQISSVQCSINAQVTTVLTLWLTDTTSSSLTSSQVPSSISVVAGGFCLTGQNFSTNNVQGCLKTPSPSNAPTPTPTSTTVPTPSSTGTPTLALQSSSSSNSIIYIAAGGGAGFIIVTIVTIAIVYVYRKKKDYRDGVLNIAPPNNEFGETINESIDSTDGRISRAEEVITPNESYYSDADDSPYYVQVNSTFSEDDAKGMGSCWTCGQDDVLSNLIQPCSCSFTFKYCHQSCLLAWIAKSDLGGGCGACGCEYINIEPELVTDVDAIEVDGRASTSSIKYSNNHHGIGSPRTRSHSISLVNQRFLDKQFPSQLEEPNRLRHLKSVANVTVAATRFHHLLDGKGIDDQPTFESIQSPSLTCPPLPPRL